MEKKQLKMVQFLESLHQHSKLSGGSYYYQCGFLDCLELAKGYAKEIEMSDYRREKAVNLMVQCLDLKKQIKDKCDQIDNLLTVSEMKDPDYVRGLSLDKIDYKIETASYVGHQLKYGDSHSVSLHTEYNKPENTVFRHVFDEFKSIYSKVK